MLSIIGVGDIMPGGVLHGKGSSFISESILSLLQQADIRVGTLETAVGDEPNFYDEKMARRADVIYVKDEDLKRLVELDINIVSLANNHFFDLGPDGAIHAIELLDSLGIQHCGAGRNLEDASKPVIFEKDGISVAFLAFCDWRDETVGWCPFATETSPGVNPMYDDYVLDQIAKNKKKYDFVVVIPHWGKEHSFVTTRDVYLLAQKMKDAGADLILGGHTHRIQPVIRYRNSIIAYSLGNFFFPDRLITSPRSTYYPDCPVNIESLPVTDRYPFVDKVTLKLWPSLARVGAVVYVCFGEKGCSAHTEYVRLKKDCSLDRESLVMSVKMILSWQGFWLKYMPYPYYESIVRACKKTVKRLVK